MIEYEVLRIVKSEDSYLETGLMLLYRNCSAGTGLDGNSLTSLATPSADLYNIGLHCNPISVTPSPLSRVGAAIWCNIQKCFSLRCRVYLPPLHFVRFSVLGPTAPVTT